MAENVAITPGSGDVVAADDISGVKFQRVKLVFGADGANDGDVDNALGLPVADAEASVAGSLTTVAFGTLTGTHADMSVNSISTAAGVFVHNDTDAAIILSWDSGTTDHHRVPARSARTIRKKAAASALYAKYESAPSTGNVHFEARA